MSGTTAGKHRRGGGGGITGRFGRIRVPLFRPAFLKLEIVGLFGRLAIQLRAEFPSEHLPSLQVEIVQQTSPYARSRAVPCPDRPVPST